MRFFRSKYADRQRHIQSLGEAGTIMIIGLYVGKFIPMHIWGQDIRFDASAHVTIACFILYTLWFFIDQNKNWHIPFVIMSGFVLTIISFQRLMVFAHNDIGLLAGFILSLFAILFAERRRLAHMFTF